MRSKHNSARRKLDRLATPAQGLDLGVSQYRFLDDQPHQDVKLDALGYSANADNLANLLMDSRASTPLTLGIEGGWGSGKSTLMKLLEVSLRKVGPEVTIVNFNAWTAKEESALEGLVKSV